MVASYYTSGQSEHGLEMVINYICYHSLCCPLLNLSHYKINKDLWWHGGKVVRYDMTTDIDKKPQDLKHYYDLWTPKSMV